MYNGNEKEKTDKKVGLSMRLREKLAKFFYGRNGPDTIYNVCAVTALVLMVVNLFLHYAAIDIIVSLLLVYAVFRLISRNVGKRQEENRKFLRFIEKIKGFFRTLKAKLTDREHVYKKCPNCKCQLRLPRKKGEHTARCPRCGSTFGVKI